LGGVYDGGPPNPIYGSLTDPAGLGSGGSCGAWDAQGGDGGGWVEIHAGNVVVDGLITANGLNGGRFTSIPRASLDQARSGPMAVQGKWVEEEEESLSITTTRHLQVRQQPLAAMETPGMAKMERCI